MATVLVVDDSQMSRRFVSLPLRDHGYDVVEAGDGLDALEKLHGQDFDLVVSDLLMPKMDGEQFLGQLRAEGYTLPVIIISADVQDSTQQRCKELGMNKFLNKPVKAETLLEAVQACLGVHEDLGTGTTK